MTREQAREILQAYRPGCDDEPLCVEALELMEGDPELRAWFDQQRQLDVAITRKLRQASAPADLLAQIQAGVAARRTRFWAQLAPLAACLVLAGVLAGFWFGRTAPAHATGFAAYRADMAEFLKQFPRLDVETEKLAEMRRWLADKHSLTEFELPAGLEKFPGIGCRTVQWRDKHLALLCFMVDGEVVHLFVLPASEFPEVSFAAVPQFTRSGKFTIASWQKGKMAYLALTGGDEAFLRGHL